MCGEYDRCSVEWVYRGGVAKQCNGCEGEDSFGTVNKTSVDRLYLYLYSIDLR